MKPLLRLLTVTVVFGCLTSSVHADRKSRAEEKARQERLELQRQQVEYILQQENDGQLTDRKQALKDLITSGDAPDEAYWQAGYIKRGDEWVSVGDRWLTLEQEQKLGEYTKARTNYADSDEGHYKLAQWCVENGFDAQAYGHLQAVLLNNPDHAGLRQLLGYEKIGGRWMNAEDYTAAVREGDWLVKELQQWGPNVVEIRDGLHSPDPRDQNRARAQLKDVTDVGAVPALELILLPSSDIGAAACVNQLCEIDHRLSSIALCNAAMFLPENFTGTKQAAIEELKTRPLDDFVTSLLSQTSAPMRLHHRLLFSRNLNFGQSKGDGVNFAFPKQIVLQTIGKNESFYLNEVFVANRVFNTRPHELRPNIQPLKSLHTILEGEILWEASERGFLDGVRDGEHKMEAIEQQRNEATNRIISLLQQVTGLSSLEEPKDWWRWWNSRTEVSTAQKIDRQVHEVFEIDRTKTPFYYVAVSCFVAGTPVWTDLGPRPIEQLKVGDMALTQNIETGELMYRPIIRTTTRKPKPLVTIDLGAEQITATGGHPFFVPGEGWVRARELKAGQFLHTPTGTIKIDSVTETPEDETYNLVVDGFHTYFVGMSQALVHDVSITSPTDAVVPGLLDR